jgi:hypothetical protein
MARRPKSKSKPKSSTAGKTSVRRTKTQTAHSRPLPGMEDRSIHELDDVAEQYAEIRDQRMELTEREHTLKGLTLKLMKKHGKTIYRHDGIEITVVPGEDDVKVRVKKAEDDTERDTEIASDDAIGDNSSASGDASPAPPPDAEQVTFGDVGADAGEFGDERRKAVNED